MRRLFIILGLVFLVAACSRLTVENYQKLKVGMKYDEVTAIIGSPDNCSETLGTRNCLWGDKKGKHIKASFVNESAVLFSHDALN